MSDPQKTRWCRHHTKSAPVVDGCEIGVDVESLKGRQPGAFYRLPCHDREHEECSKFACPVGGPEWFTDAEIAAQEAEMKAAMAKAVERLRASLGLVTEIRRGTATSGSAPCPCAGCDGTVSWRKAEYNGHVAMRCSRDDCLNFME